MKKMFTLIELIIVIAVLGVLAAIIIPNISSFQKEANHTAIQSNVRSLQTSTDMYSLDNYGTYPSQEQPKKGVPEPIDFSKVYPDYTRDLPETEGVKYWVDYYGKVWASTIDAPTNVSYDSIELKWKSVEDAAYYNVFKITDSSTTGSFYSKVQDLEFVMKVENSDLDTYTISTLPELKNKEDYLVSAVDENEFESPPVNAGYEGYKEPNPIPVNDEFIILDKSEMLIDAGQTSTWIEIIIDDYQPTGTSIEYLYTVSDNQKDWTSATKDFSSLSQGRFLKVLIKTETSSSAIEDPVVRSISAKYKNNSGEKTTADITKYNTKIDFTKYNTIYYVDSVNGNDNNNGTKTSPFKTVNHAYSNSLSGDLVYLEKGTYTFKDVNYLDKNVDFYGQSKDTVFVFNTPYIRPFGHGYGYLGIQSDNSFYNMIIETRGSQTYANYFYNKGNLAFYNVVFRDFFNLDYTDFLNYDGELYFYNTTFDVTASRNLFVRQTGTGVGTLVIQNVYGDLTLDNTYSNNYIDPSVLDDSMITTNPQLDLNYSILESGWMNGGLGENPDGSKSHIGVYGGPNAWK